MESPGNTNPTILKQKINEYAEKNGGSGGGATNELVITMPNGGAWSSDGWKECTYEASMTFSEARDAILNGALTKITVVEQPGNEYQMSVNQAVRIRVCSLDEMNFHICFDTLEAVHSGSQSLDVQCRAYIWSENGISGKLLTVK